jgi:hypothetical protein
MSITNNTLETKIKNMMPLTARQKFPIHTDTNTQSLLKYKNQCINLRNSVKDIHVEKLQMVVEEIQQDLNKWGELP